MSNQRPTSSSLNLGSFDSLPSIEPQQRVGARSGGESNSPFASSAAGREAIAGSGGGSTTPGGTRLFTSFTMQSVNASSPPSRNRGMPHLLDVILPSTVAGTTPGSTKMSTPHLANSFGIKAEESSDEPPPQLGGLAAAGSRTTVPERDRSSSLKQPAPAQFLLSASPILLGSGGLGTVGGGSASSSPERTQPADGLLRSPELKPPLGPPPPLEVMMLPMATVGPPAKGHHPLSALNSKDSNVGPSTAGTSGSVSPSLRPEVTGIRVTPTLLPTTFQPKPLSSSQQAGTDDDDATTTSLNTTTASPSQPPKPVTTATTSQILSLVPAKVLTGLMLPTAATCGLSAFLSEQHGCKYRKVGKLGEGGCGLVWAVERRTDGKRFAAKAVDITAIDPAQIPYALQEPVFMSKCKSAFVVGYEDHWTDLETKVITVMELVVGDSLGTILASKASTTSYHMQQIRRLCRKLPDPIKEELAAMLGTTVEAAIGSAGTTAAGGRSFSISASSTAQAVESVPLSTIPTAAPPFPLKVLNFLEQHNDGIRTHVNSLKALTITEPEAITYLTQILVGVHHIHRRGGLIHRDLKAGNMFLHSSSGLVKVGDFGLSGMKPEEEDALDSFDSSSLCSTSAVALSSTSANVTLKNESFTGPISSNGGTSATSGVVMGTPAYVAPELWNTTRPPYSTKSDMWSLGVILYEILAGKRPFSSQKNTAAAVTSGTYPDVRKYAPNTSKEMVELISWLLSPKAINRPSALQVLSLPFMTTALKALLQKLQAVQPSTPVSTLALEEVITVISEVESFGRMRTSSIPYVVVTNNSTTTAAPSAA